MTLYRKKHLNAFKWKRMVELCSITLIMSFISFILPLCWQVCTPVPEEGPNSSNQEEELYLKLVQFQCEPGYYNQLASLYFTSGDTAMRQLYHFRELDGKKSHVDSHLQNIFISTFLCINRRRKQLLHHRATHTVLPAVLFHGVHHIRCHGSRGTFRTDVSLRRCARPPDWSLVELVVPGLRC